LLFLKGKQRVDKDAELLTAGICAEASKNVDIMSSVESCVGEQLTCSEADRTAAATHGDAFATADIGDNGGISFFVPSHSGDEVAAVYVEVAGDATATEEQLVAGNVTEAGEQVLGPVRRRNAGIKWTDVPTSLTGTPVNKRKRRSTAFSRYFVSSGDAEAIMRCRLLPTSMPLLAITKSNVTTRVREAGEQTFVCGSFSLMLDDLMSLLPENWLTDKVSLVTNTCVRVVELVTN
jgi:hypothetical protein